MYIAYTLYLLLETMDIFQGDGGVIFSEIQFSTGKTSLEGNYPGEFSRENFKWRGGGINQNSCIEFVSPIVLSLSRLNFTCEDVLGEFFHVVPPEKFSMGIFPRRNLPSGVSGNISVEGEISGVKWKTHRNQLFILFAFFNENKDNLVEGLISPLEIFTVEISVLQILVLFK